MTELVDVAAFIETLDVAGRELDLDPWQERILDAYLTGRPLQMVRPRREHRTEDLAAVALAAAAQGLSVTIACMDEASADDVRRRIRRRIPTANLQKSDRPLRNPL